MARYRGPRVKVMRALGTQLPGLSRKSSDRRPNPPGTAPGTHRRKKSVYGLQLQEKQKLRFNYGVSENYMRKIAKEAFRSREQSGDKMLELLERRLDNVVFRAGLAPTIPAARQLIRHNHVFVNGVRTNIPSYRVVVGTKVVLTEKAAKLPMVVNTMEQPAIPRPAWIIGDTEKAEVEVAGLPTSESVPFPLEVAKVVEYYARIVKK